MHHEKKTRKILMICQRWIPISVMHGDTIWLFPPPADPHRVHSVAQSTGLPFPLAELLERRGFAEQSDAFLDPRLRQLGDPFLLPDMRLAVDRILRAIDGGERIVLFGDYDVDGVTSLAFLRHVLMAYGADVSTFLPHRIEEGYGLSHLALQRCLDEHRPKLLVAVDCGTSSVKEISSVRSQGIDVVVLDHHECPAELPQCVALVNPKRGDRFRYLCSVGVAFKLAHALGMVRRLEKLDLRDILDLVALGTVADIVPLVDENRILVRAGCLRLAKSRFAGIRALMEVAGVSGPVRCDDIGFRLGPRLNAAGRLDSAVKALRLLTTEDAGEARTLAHELDVQNRERQEVERRILGEAERQVSGMYDPARHAVIVAGDTGWHPGVLGIVAARLCRSYHRPTFVVGFDETGSGKGSGRSVEGISLVGVLGPCASYLEKFGGHEMAAGLSMRLENLPRFREALNDAVLAASSPEILQRNLKIDGEVGFADLDDRFLEHHEKLQPFGSGHRHPVFCSRGIQPVEEPRVMKEKHLRLKLRHHGRRMDAVYFSGAERPLPRPPWDVAFRIEPNTYQGVTRLQLQVVAMRTAAA